MAATTGFRPPTWLLLQALWAVACPSVVDDADDDDSSASFRRLWVPHFDKGELQGWAADRLSADPTGGPDIVLRLPDGTHANAAAFDADGDLWVTDNAGHRLLELAARDLSTSGSPTPATIIETDGASLRSPIGLVSDGEGGLWVAVEGRVELFVASDLDGPGPTTPTRTLTHVGFDQPAGLTFDDEGDLWLSDAAPDDGGANDNAVMAFAPAQLAAGGEQTPLLTLTYTSFALVEGLQFDDDGDLWVASNDGLAVSRFDADDVALPGASEVRAVEPVGSLESDDDDSATGRSVRKPGGILFDPDGNLWVNSERGDPGDDLSAVLRFDRAQLDDVIGSQGLSAAVLLERATSNPGFGGLALER